MSSKGEEEIDIDDPDFWEKWAKKAELDVDLMNKVGNRDPNPNYKRNLFPQPTYLLIKFDFLKGEWGSGEGLKSKIEMSRKVFEGYGCGFVVMSCYWFDCGFQEENF